MPKMLCECGEILSWSSIPNPIGWLLIADVAFSERLYRVADLVGIDLNDVADGRPDVPLGTSELHSAMTSMMKCPQCGRLWVFWDGFGKPPSEYLYVPPRLKESDVLYRAREAQAREGLAEAEREQHFRALHELAEAQDSAAQTFFVSMLRHPSSDWRLACIRDLGHYPLVDDNVAENLRWILVNDPDADVRIVAASLLGTLPGNEWPDWALAQAIDEDPIYQVRVTAFRSLLNQSGVSYVAAIAFEAQANERSIQPTLAALRAIVAAKDSTGI